ncbi:MAG: glucoamylase family protein [Anaerolineales bacterium]|nr:glucoamylase family protein [Anaerolineales bacterium]
MANAERYKTYGENSWGLSAGDSPHGYDVFGAPPCRGEPHHDGTISIYAAIACLPFLPDESLALIDHLYREHPQCWGKYGFFDAYNLDVSPAWYSQDIYAIDKGVSMILLENYLTRLVWEVYTDSPYLRRALEILAFKEISSLQSDRK